MRLSVTRLAQWLKVLVYALLLVNFAGYFVEELEEVRYTARAGWGLLDWTGAFATTLDELGWFGLLFLFELETYLLSDEAFTPRVIRVMHVLRLLCCVVIGHTLFAYGDYYASVLQVEAQPAPSLCTFLGQEVSFTRNLEYWVLDAGNCSALSADSNFFFLESGALVTDSSGLTIERELAFVDVVEVISWLLIVLLIEVAVRLQERGIAGGPLLRTVLVGKAVLYCVLWCVAAYWAYRGHWLYVWDEALWILGFMAIGMNLREWRQEIEAEAESG